MSHDTNEEKKGCKCGCGGDANNRYCQLNHCSDMCKHYNGSTPPSEVSTGDIINVSDNEKK